MDGPPAPRRRRDLPGSSGPFCARHVRGRNGHGRSGIPALAVDAAKRCLRIRCAAGPRGPSQSLRNARARVPRNSYSLWKGRDPVGRPIASGPRALRRRPSTGLFVRRSVRAGAKVDGRRVRAAAAGGLAEGNRNRNRLGLASLFSPAGQSRPDARRAYSVSCPPYPGFAVARALDDACEQRAGVDGCAVVR